MPNRQTPNGSAPIQGVIGGAPLLLITLGLFAFVVAVYSPSYRYGFLYDETVILFRTTPPRTAGEFLQRAWAPHFPSLEYFRPLPHAMYLAEYTLHRNEPGYFHLFNAVLMGLTACVAFALLRLPVFGIRTLPAALAAVLFAVHPASSSSVMPIVGRETLLASCLSLGAIYGMLRGGRSWYPAALALFALALLSKEQAAVLPVLFVLGDVLGLSADAPGRDVGRWFRRYAPCAVVLAGYLFVRWSIFAGAEYRLQVWEEPLGPVWSAAYALQTVFTPSRELAYEPARDVWMSSGRLTIACLLLCGLVVAVIRRWGTLRHSALYWAGWFLLTLAPTANVIRQQAPYSERYVLLATLAVVAVAASVVSTMRPSWPVCFGTAAVGLAVIAASTAATIHRGGTFESKLTFARQWAKTSPHFGEAQMALGVELYLVGRIDEAAESFQAGLESEPAARRLCRQWLAKMRLLQGRFSEAEQHLSRLIEEDPPSPYACFWSGVALGGLGDTDNAVARFQQAVTIDADFAGAHFLLAESLGLQGRPVLSRYHLGIASKLPVMDLSFSRIGDAHLERLGRFSDLRFLILEATAIGDAGLKQLEKLTGLHRLWMPGTRVTDQGLLHLRGFVHLNSLVLTDTRITDEAVEHLVLLKGLKHLDVRNTKLTREGLAELKRELPDCLILQCP